MVDEPVSHETMAAKARLAVAMAVAMTSSKLFNSIHITVYIDS
jgi:hypothetical protein